MKKGHKIVFSIQVTVFAAAWAMLIYCTVRGAGAAPKLCSKGIVASSSVLTAITVLANMLLCHFIRTKENLIEKLTSIIPGGYLECYVDDSLTIKHCSQELLNYLGFSYIEFKQLTGGQMINLIAPEDRQRVVTAYQEYKGKKNNEITFDLICNGERKMSVVSLFSHKRQFKHIIKSIDTIQIYILDTQAFKQLAVERDIDAERYYIVAEQSESIIYDYNIVDGNIFLNSNFERKFGYAIDKNTHLWTLIKSDKLVYEDDVHLIKELDFKNNKYYELELRVKRASGEYLWCKVRMSVITDKRTNEPVKAIGKIIDVNKSRVEKIELIEQTRRDLMTGLYNRSATESIITDELNNAKPKDLFAFLMFDVDNFKQINDAFGHMKGDKVLLDMADEIKTIFRSSDILGRVGGDEFVIFLKDLPSEQHAIKKAESVLSIISDKYDTKKDGFKITASLGISFYKKDGKTFNELFEKADIALYVSKASGKNKVSIYQPSYKKDLQKQQQ